MKYWCFNCDCAVEPETVPHYEYHAEVDTRQLERWDEHVCPCCHEELTEEADLCECGEWKPENQVLCESCLGLAKEAYNQALDYVQTRLSAGTRSQAENTLLSYIERYQW